jgi:hypothetical protein
MQNLTPESGAIIDAITADRQAEALRPLVTPYGMNLQTTELIRLLASPQQTAPLMRELIRETPALLEPLRGVGKSPDKARWDERWKLVRYRLAPAINVLSHFSESTDTSVIDLTLPCFPLLRDDSGEELRLYLTWYLAMICQANHEDPVHHRLSDDHATALRTLFWEETKCSTPDSNAQRFAYLGLGLLSDSKTITALIEAQSQRPIGPSHSRIVGALSNTVSELDAADAEARRIKASWIDSLRELSKSTDRRANESEHVKEFATAISRTLYQKKLTVGEERTLRTLANKTKATWLRELITSTLNNVPEPAKTLPDRLKLQGNTRNELKSDSSKLELVVRNRVNELGGTMTVRRGNDDSEEVRLKLMSKNSLVSDDAGTTYSLSRPTTNGRHA